MSIQPEIVVSYGNDSVKAAKGTIPWLWDGVIALEAITLLSAPEKTGKTTLLSLLLDRLRQGGQLLGRAVRPGRTVLVSEENKTLWEQRQPPLDFGPDLEFHRPIHDRPTPGRWRRFTDHLLGHLWNTCFDLLVIDSVMRFLPAGPNNPAAMRDALCELRMLAEEGTAVLLLHQACSVRSRSRARGPLTAFADILIDMQIPPGTGCPRCRHFHGIGRYPGTLPFVAAELNAEGTDYLVLPDAPPQPARDPALETLRQLLSQSPTPLTRQEIVARWPATEPPPRPDSLWRCLMRGCELGLFIRTGAGNRAEAFRYGLAERESAA
jgi:hypothetical protein